MSIEEINAELEAKRQAIIEELEAEKQSRLEAFDASVNQEKINALNDARNNLVNRQVEISGEIEAIDNEIVALTPVVEEFHPEIEEVVEG